MTDTPKEPPKALSKEQIEMAKLLIEDLHQIKQTPYDVSFPYFCGVCGVFRRCFRNLRRQEKQDELQSKLLTHFSNVDGMSKEQRKLFRMRQRKKEKDIQDKKDVENKDPYLSLGFGLIAYRNTLFTLSLVFIVLSFLMWPIVGIYQQGDGFNSETVKTRFGNYSLGNMGYSTVQCASIPFGMETVVLQCPYGKISKIVENGVGINSVHAQQKTACLVDEEKFQNAGCSKHVNKQQIQRIFDKHCVNEADCYMKFSNSTHLVDMDIEANDGRCSDQRATFFIQYTCEQDEADQYLKYQELSKVTAIIMFVAFLYILLIYYLQTTSRLDQQQYDMNTITAGDFTVELDIPERMWQFFLENHHQEEGMTGVNGEAIKAPARQLKKYLHHKIQEIVAKSMRQRLNMPELDETEAQKKTMLSGLNSVFGKLKAKKKPKGRVHLNEELSPEEKCQVQDIQFAYNNHQLINLLKKRGLAITNCNFDQMRVWESQIGELIKDEQGYDLLTRPVCAFITFKSDDAYNEALNYSKKAKWYERKQEDATFEHTMLLNEDPFFTAATEPTNIIWENRHIKGINFASRMVGAIMISFFMLLLSFFLIIYFKRTEIEYKNKFPAVNCDAIYKVYGDETVLTYAGFEYFEEIKTNGKAPMNGNLQCFCEHAKKEHARLKGNKLDWYIKEGYKKNFTVSSVEGESIERPICKKYQEDFLIGEAMANVLKYVIIIFNTVIRMVVIFIVNKVGCSTESSQMTYITDSVFVCQFFNTGFLLMLCSANLEGQGFLFSSFFRGDVSDFNMQFFTSTGDIIVGSMVFNVWFPIFMEFFWWGYRSLFRLKDKLRAPEGEATSCLTLQQYVNIYSGPTYFMHYKYSSIMNIVFITMMFGCGLPILFPIGAASLVVLYCLEKYMLYYVYKSPPAYDEKLNNSVLQNLALAPLFFLAFSYWMLTNKQLLQNNLTPIETREAPFLAGHYWYDALTPAGFFKSGPAGLLLIFFFAYLFYLLFRGPFNYVADKFCKALLLEDLEIDEDIDIYPNCLDDDDKNWTEKEEANLREFGMPALLPSQLASIQEGRMKSPSMHLQGIHTYDILRNPTYIQAFQYFSADLPDRADYIIDDDDDPSNDCGQSDLVRVLLKLAYLDQERVQATEFTATGIQALKT